MTIPEDIEAVREWLEPPRRAKGETFAALSRLEAEIWRRGEQVGELLAERDALKAANEELLTERQVLMAVVNDATEQAGRLREERDALKAEVERLRRSERLALDFQLVTERECEALKETNARLTGMLPTSDYNEIRAERDLAFHDRDIAVNAVEPLKAERDALKAALEEIAYRLHGNFEKETPEEQAVRVARQALAAVTYAAMDEVSGTGYAREGMVSDG